MSDSKVGLYLLYEELVAVPLPVAVELEAIERWWFVAGLALDLDIHSAWLPFV